MGMVGKHAIVNGLLVDSTEATLPVHDRELQYGFGVYESLRVIQGKVVYPQDHMVRLFYSADGLGLRHRFNADQVLGWLYLLLESDNIQEATIRVLLMGGMEARLFITASPLLAYPETFYTEGIKAISYHGERFLPQFKTCSLLMNYLALRQASSQGAFEAVLVDSKGLVLEGTRSNLFACRGKVVYTAPSCAVLEGVTRDKILKAAEQLGYPVVFEAPALSDLVAGQFDELFISSTSMGAMPVSSLDGRVFAPPFSVASAIHTLIRYWEVDALH
ncbi:MAG: aminotransferase class IV [Sphaerochaeta sp.]|jgi:D-alanine transaminase/branched-chain amino acid aminotransferase|nr:aminotransferase class IV [Sphaerochaeta sp.]